MIAPVFDLSARRAAHPLDRGRIVENLAAGAESLHAAFRSWPVRFVREADIISAERVLVELQEHLVALRGFVPAGGAPDAA